MDTNGKLRTTRYQVKHAVLKPFIKYFWVMESTDIKISHKLLPVNNIDLILNFSSPIRYITKQNKELVPAKFHFNGIKDRYCMINQEGKLNVFGISFFPSGLYPFLKIPICEFTQKTIDLNIIANKFVLDIDDQINEADSTLKKLDILEEGLLKLISNTYIPNSNISNILHCFYENMVNMNIQLFCDQYGISKRKLERIFNKYVGVSPKSFYRISRFQKVFSKIINQEKVDLTFEAYQNNYYDQTHFLKDFKTFTGCSPTQFLNEKRAVKQII